MPLADLCSWKYDTQYHIADPKKKLKERKEKENKENYYTRKL